MQIFLKVAQADKVISIDVEPLDSIMGFKAKIEVQEGLPPAMQRLVFHGQVLEDEWTLEDCRITKECTLRLVKLSNVSGPAAGNFWSVSQRCPIKGKGLLHSTSLPDLAQGVAVASLRPSISAVFRHTLPTAAAYPGPGPGHIVGRLLAEPSRMAVLELRPDLAALSYTDLVEKLDAQRHLYTEDLNSAYGRKVKWMQMAAAGTPVVPLTLAGDEGDPNKLTATPTRDLQPGRLYALALLHLRRDKAGHYVADELFLPFRTAAPSAIEGHFECPICCETCVEPTTASCGQHNFCLSHLQEWIADTAGKPGGATCPVCRQRIQQAPAECRINTGIRGAIEAARAGCGSSATSPALPRPPLIPCSALAYPSSQQLGGSCSALHTVHTASYLGEPCAVQALLLPPGGASAALQALFWQHSALQYHLRHEGIAQLHGVCVVGGGEGGPATRLALVMQRYACSLESTLAAAAPATSAAAAAAAVAAPPPTLALCLQWLRQIAAALRFLHARGIVHGALRPSAVLLDASGQRALLGSLQHARQQQEGQGQGGSAPLLPLPSSGSSLRYRDPAAAAAAAASSSSSALRSASDVYSFAILAWQLLSGGQAPFEGMEAAAALAHAQAGGRPPLQTLPQQLPAALHALLQQCWAGEQEARPTAADICAALG